MVIRNKLLYKKLIKLTEKVINILEQMPKEQYPSRNEIVYLFKDNGYETKQETKIHYGRLFLNLREKISQFPEFIECSEYMVKNRPIRRTFKVTDNVGNPIKVLEPIDVYDFNLRFFLESYFNKTVLLFCLINRFSITYTPIWKIFFIKKLVRVLLVRQSKIFIAKMK